MDLRPFIARFVTKLAETEAAAHKNRFIYRNFAGGTLETGGDDAA